MSEEYKEIARKIIGPYMSVQSDTCGGAIVDAIAQALFEVAAIERDSVMNVVLSKVGSGWSEGAPTDAATVTEIALKHIIADAETTERERIKTIVTNKAAKLSNSLGASRVIVANVCRGILAAIDKEGE